MLSADDASSVLIRGPHLSESASMTEAWAARSWFDSASVVTDAMNWRVVSSSR